MQQNIKMTEQPTFNCTTTTSNSNTNKKRFLPTLAEIQEENELPDNEELWQRKRTRRTNAILSNYSLCEINAALMEITYLQKVVDNRKLDIENFLRESRNKIKDWDKDKKITDLENEVAKLKEDNKKLKRENLLVHGLNRVLTGDIEKLLDKYQKAFYSMNGDEDKENENPNPNPNELE